MEHDRDKSPLDRSLEALNSYLFGGRTLIQTLDEVSRRALDALPAAFIAVIVAVEGRPKTAVFTDELAKLLDDVQYAADSGPCLDSFRDGAVYIIDDMTTETRWPAFAEAAAANRVMSTMSLPLLVGEVRLGAMNCYSPAVSTFGADEQRVGEAFASQASILLANAQAYYDAHVMSENLWAAMQSRAVIEQAKGIIMANTRCSPDAAFDLLTKQSQHENRKLREIAAELVQRASRN